MLAECRADFFTTFSVYSLFFLLIVFLKRKYIFSANVMLLISGIIISFFFAEIVLRYGFKYPQSYTEANGGKYASPSRGFWIDRLHLKAEGHRKDLHTLEFRPFEERSIARCEKNNFPNEIYNQLGLRGDIPEKGKKIIVTFGDSFTEGACVVLKNSYPEILKNLLQTANNDFDILNAGISGNDPFFDWKMLLKLHDQFQIHTAIFLINSSDISDIIARGGKERFLENGDIQYLKTPCWEYIYSFSYVFRLFIHNALKYDREFFRKNEKQIKETEALTKLKELFIDEISPFCLKNNINLVIAIHPLDWELDNAGNYENLRKTMLEIQNAKIIDTYTAIKKQNSIDALYLSVDKHFNGKGYRLIANEIFKKIEQQTAFCL